MKLLKLADKFEKGKFEGKSVSVVINKGESSYLKWILARNKDIRLHGEVIKFIQSKSQVNFNRRMVETLHELKTSDSSYVAKKLIYLGNRKRINTIFTNVKASKNKLDTVTYDVPFGNKNNEIKVGRFVRKIFNMNDIEFTDAQIEQFVTDYYGKVGESLTKSYFKIVKGEDIRKYYHEREYHSNKGSLGKSCMRYTDSQPRFDLYCFNPNEVEMLVLFNRESDKVIGRAILWKDSTIDNYNGDVFNGTFMDRIYVNDSKDEALFLEYAKKNGFAYKQEQSYNSKSRVVVNGKNMSAQIKVKLSRNGVNSPYLDTVAYRTNDGYYNGY